MSAASAPEAMRYCPRCAAPLVTRPVGDKLRRCCSQCDFIYFTDPKVGVGALVIEQGRILLVRRAMTPERGKWSIPAGFLDYGDDPRETAVEEVRQETNLQVEITELLDVYHNPQALQEGGASVFILYRARLIGGRLAAGDDASEAAFFAPDSLPILAFASTRDAIGRWLTKTI